MHSLEAALTWLQLAFLMPLGILGLHRGWMVLLRLRHSRPVDRRVVPAELPVVTVQLPIFNERYVAERLVEAVAALDYPHDRLEIQVLDDSTDDTTEILERCLRRLPPEVDVKLIRRHDRTGFKAGALGNGLALAKGELIAVFDADFVPPRDFLRRVVPSFADADVGMVQTRWDHLNAEGSLLTEVQATLLDGHFLVEHVARSRSGCFFNFNGTGGIFRRQCIEDAGGWQYDTITEDLDLSYRAQLAGWRFVYRPDIACPAELPADMNAYHVQQFRWAKGAIQCGLKLAGRILRAPVGPVRKAESLFHLFGNFAFPLLLGLILVSLPLHLTRLLNGSRIGLTFEFLESSPLFLATVSVFLYYGFATVMSGRATPASFLRLPWMVAVGGALALTNTRAVLAAFDRDPGEFIRTPKDASGPGHRRRATRYRSRRGLQPLFELGLAAWAASTATSAALLGMTAPAIFHAMFALGLAWSGGMSIRQDRAAASVREDLAFSSANS